jgi:tetratricopeptide (TPR) repeat protein
LFEAVEAQWKLELDKAIQLYTRVLALDANNAQAYFNRGVAYRSKGDENRAFADFTQAIAKNPGLVDALYGRGLINLHRKAYDKALEDLNRVIELDPKHFSAYRVRGEAQIGLGNFEAALVWTSPALYP